MDTLNCVVKRITYEDEENSYRILQCERDNGSIVTVKGEMPEMYTGTRIQAEGEWERHPKYGPYFEVKTIRERLPVNQEEMLKYLSGGKFKGIGPTHAKRIIEHFGDEIFSIMENDIDRLCEVRGIGEKRFQQIKESWQANYDRNYFYAKAQSFGLSIGKSEKIWEVYGKASEKTMVTNPYEFADTVYGFGFLTVDELARRIGFQLDSYTRLYHGLLYVLKLSAGTNGHCFAYTEALIEEGAQLLNVEDPPLREALEQMKVDKLVLQEGDAIYLPEFYYSEAGCARIIQQMLEEKENSAEFEFNPDSVIKKVLQFSEIEYDEIQMDAIKTAVTNKITVLTGGPGTGKTTTTLGILSVFQNMGMQVLLAAPTGRAAKRLSEATGMEAKTVHRLLGIEVVGDKFHSFQRDARNPLEGDALIIDECSMIDIHLMYSILKAVPKGMTLVMVGDADQLPSVGPGNVLNDIIRSGVVPVVRLQRIFRQAQGSRIIRNAHRINHGQFIEVKNGASSDFFFQVTSTKEETLNKIVEFCTTRLPAYFGVSPSDIQVLSPMKKGIIGTINLNAVLQDIINPKREGEVSARYSMTEFRPRDKVMQTKNNYLKDIFNGDIGFVLGVNPENGSLVVRFDEKIVSYEHKELKDLVLAYATTIHKSQGSEYPIVVIPFMMAHFTMLQRNLIYTGVTRAKQVCVLVGEPKAVGYAIKNESPSRRNTRLAERLRGELFTGYRFQSRPISSFISRPVV